MRDEIVDAAEKWCILSPFYDKKILGHADVHRFAVDFALSQVSAAVTAYRERVERAFEKAELFDAQTPHERAIFKALKSELAKGDATK